MLKRIWAAITAHKPLERIDCLINLLRGYMEFPFSFEINIYIDYASQDDIEVLEVTLSEFKKLNLQIKVASPAYEGWYLTWAHKTDLAQAILNNKADYYIYTENDMLMNYENFKYYLKWKPALAKYKLEPGFVRYEKKYDKKIPFDNYHKYSLTKETPNVWSDQGYKVPNLLVVDYSVSFFVALANPYYGAMILDQNEGEQYIRSDSYDPHKSYEKVGIRNWPIADRSSMGLAFESPPPGFQHRRCVPVRKVKDHYEILDCGLICHDDDKYTKNLQNDSDLLICCASMLTI
jgi:hypothetical protein